MYTGDPTCGNLCPGLIMFWFLTHFSLTRRTKRESLLIHFKEPRWCHRDLASWSTLSIFWEVFEFFFFIRMCICYIRLTVYVFSLLSPKTDGKLKTLIYGKSDCRSKTTVCTMVENHMWNVSILVYNIKYRYGALVLCNSPLLITSTYPSSLHKRRTRMSHFVIVL